MSAVRGVLLRILEEVIPIATFVPRKRRKLKAAQADEEPANAARYCEIDVEELSALLDDDRGRAATVDEKSFKLSLSLSVALTVLGTLSPILFDRITSRWLLIVCGVFILASVFNALVGGFIALGAMDTLPSYGRGPLGIPKGASGARRRLLASSLARNELVGIARQLRNSATYQHLRNGLICLSAALCAYVFGLATGGAVLKPPTAVSSPATVVASAALKAAKPATPSGLDLRLVGQTSALAQAANWLTNDIFVIGRWDGTISVFRVPRAGEAGPVLEAVMAAPSHHGIEMVARLDDLTFASSDGVGHIALWRRGHDGFFSLMGNPTYDPAYGAANSATTLLVNGETLFATGHEDGHVIVWRWTGAALTVMKAFDVRSPGAIANPWGLHNIRGLQTWRGSILVTGSEDGDIVGLGMPDGKEVFRARYNVTAQRGINSVSVRNDILLVANCAVGNADRNAWLFDLSSGHPVLLDAENLVQDSKRAQVFDFDAILVTGAGGGVDFFAATEEGLLWQGRVDGRRLIVDGFAKPATDGAAVIASSPNDALVASASGSIRLYKPE